MSVASPTESRTQLAAALCPAGAEHGSSSACRHTSTESVLACTLEIVGLEGALHRSLLGSGSTCDEAERYTSKPGGHPPRSLESPERSERLLGRQASWHQRGAQDDAARRTFLVSRDRPEPGGGDQGTATRRRHHKGRPSEPDQAMPPRHEGQPSFSTGPCAAREASCYRPQTQPFGPRPPSVTASEGADSTSVAAAWTCLWKRLWKMGRTAGIGQ